MNQDPIDLRQQPPQDEPPAALAALQEVTGSVAARIADLTEDQVRAVWRAVCGGGQ